MYRVMDTYSLVCLTIHMHMSHRGVFGTIKSLVHALGTGTSVTEPTINSTL